MKNFKFILGNGYASLPVFILLFTAPMLALSSFNTFAAGLAWLLIMISGLVARLKNDLCYSTSENFLYTNGSLKAIRWWLITCVASFVLMAIPTAFWGGPWSERHPQWRLLLGAIGLWLLSRHHLPWSYVLRVLATGCSITLIAAWLLVVFLGADAAPTNRIPWMAGLCLLSCTLLTMSYQIQTGPKILRRVWWLASALTLSTVLLSGVRGSWGLLIIWPLAWIFLQRLDQGLWNWTPIRVTLLFLAWILLTGIGDQAIPAKDRLTSRISLAWQESGVVATNAGVQANSSVGIRLVMYQAGLMQVVAQPNLLGIGHEEHKQLLKTTVQAVAPEMANVIGHYHADWLNPWVEFGLLGLLGYLSILIGILFIAFFSPFENGFSTKVGILCLLAMHFSTGLTNVNFAHNYYPVMLSISMALVLLGDFAKSSSYSAL